MPVLALPFGSIIDVPTARILARDDAGTGPVEALTNTELFAILGTGTPSNTTYLRGDGTWSTVSAGISSLNGLTDATQTFAVGTTGTDVAFVSAAGVHTLNIPDASATARGVVTTGTQTFAGAKTFTTAPKIALPSTSTSTLGSASPSSSQWVFLVNTTNAVNRPIGIVFGGYDGFFHLALQSVMTSAGANTYGKVSFIGQQGVEYFRVSTQTGLPTTAAGVTVADALHFGAFGATNITADCAITRWAADHITFRRGTNAQTVSVANTYTSDTSYERLNIAWASNVCYIGTEKGSAGGTARDLTIGTDGVVRAVFPAATTSGAFYLGPRADNTATGGNARGNNAVDLQTDRDAATQVAGNYSIIAGRNNTASGAGYHAVFGYRNSASGGTSLVAGEGCSATGYGGIVAGNFSSSTANEGFAVFGRSVVVSGNYGFGSGYQTEVVATAGFGCGHNARARLQGEFAHASGRFAANGDCQRVSIVLRGKTTTNAAVELVDPTRFTIPAGFIFHGTIKISGAKSDGSAVAAYERQVRVKRVGNATTLVGTVNTVGTDEAAGTSIAITADDTNESAKIEATGVLNETWRWEAVIEGGLYAYGT